MAPKTQGVQPNFDVCRYLDKGTVILDQIARIDRKDVTGDGLPDYVQLERICACPDVCKEISTLIAIESNDQGNTIIRKGNDKFQWGDMVLVGEKRYLLYDIPLPQITPASVDNLMVILISEDALNRAVNLPPLAADANDEAKAVRSAELGKLIVEGTIAVRLKDVAPAGDAKALIKPEVYTAYTNFMLNGIGPESSANLITYAVRALIQKELGIETAPAEGANPAAK